MRWVPGTPYFNVWASKIPNWKAVGLLPCTRELNVHLNRTSLNSSPATTVWTSKSSTGYLFKIYSSTTDDHLYSMLNFRFSRCGTDHTPEEIKDCGRSAVLVKFNRFIWVLGLQKLALLTVNWCEWWRVIALARHRSHKIDLRRAIHHSPIR